MPPTVRDGIDVVEQNHSENDAAFHAGDDWRDLLSEFLDTGLVGEAAGVVSHELNNVFNNFVLMIAVLKRRLPEDVREELAPLRQQALLAADLQRQFDQYRGRRRQSPVRTDLNEVVRTTLGLTSHPVEVTYAEGLPPVLATRLDLFRVTHLLVANAAVAGGDELPVRLRTEHCELGARLAVDDHGPPVPDDLLPQLFEPGHTLREGNDPLDLAACRATVLRWRGNAWAANRPGGGMTFAIELAVAEPAAR
jgi:two-component system NtrC family sensor kinase